MLTDEVTTGSCCGSVTCQRSPHLDTATTIRAKSTTRSLSTHRSILVQTMVQSTQSLRNLPFSTYKGMLICIVFSIECDTPQHVIRVHHHFKPCRHCTTSHATAAPKPIVVSAPTEQPMSPNGASFLLHCAVLEPIHQNSYPSSITV